MRCCLYQHLGSANLINEHDTHIAVGNGDMLVKFLVTPFI